MAGKLALDRDFTRFITDETFPYKVTVCIEDERIVCSGVLLAQQSKVLERKIREDDGVLMFEEMLEVANCNMYLHQCVQFLHGADLVFNYEGIKVVLKFASWYEIKDLFKEALKWLTFHLSAFVWNSEEQIREIMQLFKVSNCLSSCDSTKLKDILYEFINNFKQHLGNGILKYVGVGVSGYDIVKIIEQNLANNGSILNKWALLSKENKHFIVSNNGLFDFKEVFPGEDEFSDFISIISDDVTSVEYVKSLLEIQKDYFNKREGSSSTMVGHNSHAQSEAPETFEEHIEGNVQNMPQTSWLSNDLPSVTANENTGGNAQNMPLEAQLRNARLSATANENTGGNAQNMSQEVHVTNLPPLGSKTKLRKLFRFAGRITNIDISMEDASAVVTFEDVASANALRECQLCSRDFVLDGFVLGIDKSSSEGPDSDNDNFVYIGNLPPSADEMNLKSIFSGFGKFENIRILKNKRSHYYAFIEFTNARSASKLLRKSETHEFSLMGYSLIVAERCSR